MTTQRARLRVLIKPTTLLAPECYKPNGYSFQERTLAKPLAAESFSSGNSGEIPIGSGFQELVYLRSQDHTWINSARQDGFRGQ